MTTYKWIDNTSSFIAAFNSDICLNYFNPNANIVSALAYDSTNNKIYAGGHYGSNQYDGAGELFVSSSADDGTTWSQDVSSIWQAFNSDISLNYNDNFGTRNSVTALAYDPNNNKMYAGGYYSSNQNNGNLGMFVSSSSNGTTWSNDVSSIWQAFNGDISLNYNGNKNTVNTLAYNPNNQRMYAGGYYNSNQYNGVKELFVSSTADDGTTWSQDVSSIWQAFNGDISLNYNDNFGTRNSVTALAYDPNNNKMYAGGYYSSNQNNGNLGMFVSSSSNGTTWSNDVSSIWQAFNGDIKLDDINTVTALAYDPNNQRMYAGGYYSSNQYPGDTQPFICSLSSDGTKWTKENIPNPGSSGVINAIAIDGPIAGGQYSDGNPIMYSTIINNPGLPICFQKGTRIETPSGKKAIEELKEGDLVKSKNGRAVAIVKMIHFIGDAETCGLFVLPANTLKRGMPSRDLYMSNNHAYKDEKGQWHHMKCSKQTRSIEKDQIEYYHIVTNDYFSDTLYAEDVEVESCFVDKGDGVLMLWECNGKKCVPMRCSKPKKKEPEPVIKKKKSMFSIYQGKEEAQPINNNNVQMWRKPKVEKPRMLWAYNKDGTQEALECVIIEL